MEILASAKVSATAKSNARWRPNRGIFAPSRESLRVADFGMVNHSDSEEDFMKLILALLFVASLFSPAARAVDLERFTFFDCGPISRGRVMWEQDVRLRLSHKRAIMEISPRDVYNGQFVATDTQNTVRSYLDRQYRTGQQTFLLVPTNLWRDGGRVTLIRNLEGSPIKIVYQCQSKYAEG